MLDAIGFTSRLYPRTNQDVASILYALECGLRELVIEVLAERYGSFWYKSRLPGDVLEKYKRGKTSEFETKWTQHVPHHPIYYVDFPDLGKVIHHNAADFKEFFSEPAILTSSLRSLEPIRNKVAHNRKVCVADVAIAEGVFTQVMASIGEAHLATLANRCTSASDIGSHLAGLREEVRLAELNLTALSPPCDAPTWRFVRAQWWFDALYLLPPKTDRLQEAQMRLASAKAQVVKDQAQVDKLVAALSKKPTTLANSSLEDPLQAVRDFFSLQEHYCQLPRQRGTGHLIESWRNSHDIATVAAAAQQTLESLATEFEKNYEHDRNDNA